MDYCLLLSLLLHHGLCLYIGPAVDQFQGEPQLPDHFQPGTQHADQCQGERLPLSGRLFPVHHQQIHCSQLDILSVCHRDSHLYVLHHPAQIKIQ